SISSSLGTGAGGRASGFDACAGAGGAGGRAGLGAGGAIGPPWPNGGGWVCARPGVAPASADATTASAAVLSLAVVIWP
ncbi:MAG TPA: hypothetical protein VKQ32_21830, partial [Polyangia bacterium]|nr:hypothetical protein [Polyangia bacterium]